MKKDTKGYLVVVGSTLIMFFATFVSFTQFVIPLRQDITPSIALLSWCGSLRTTGMMLVAPLASLLYKHAGSRLSHLLGVTLLAVCCLVSGFATSIVHLFLAYSLLGGFASGLVMNCPIFLVAEWFPYEHHRHMLTAGVLSSAGPLGILLGNPLSYLLIAYVGWRNAYYIFAAIIFAIGGLICLFLVPPGDSHGGGEGCGAEEDPGGEYVPLEEEEERDVATTLGKVIIHMMWFIESAVVMIGSMVPLITMSEQMTSIDLAQSDSALVMVASGVVGFLSRIIIVPLIGNHIKGKIIEVHCLVCLCGAIYNFVGTMASTFTHYMLYGIGYSSTGFFLLSIIYPSSMEVIPGGFVGTPYMVGRMGHGMGSAIGPILAGYLYDTTGSFKAVFYFLAYSYLVAAMATLIISLLNRYRPRYIYTNATSRQSQDIDLSEKDEARVPLTEAEH